MTSTSGNFVSMANMGAANPYSSIAAPGAFATMSEGPPMKSMGQIPQTMSPDMPSMAMNAYPMPSMPPSSMGPTGMPPMSMPPSSMPPPCSMQGPPSMQMS